MKGAAHSAVMWRAISAGFVEDFVGNAHTLKKDHRVLQTLEV